MIIGYEQPLYILPFDHRASFVRGLFSASAPLTADLMSRVKASKRVVYDGFKAALSRGVPREGAGILVDEQFGADILHEARVEGILTCAPVEKSGCEELRFEYGREWRAHIAAVDPTFAKVLVRYNPEGDPATNKRQAESLRALSEYAHQSSRRLMFELLVPMTPAQSDLVEGDVKEYDDDLRPQLMLTAIHELQDAGVEPDIWKVEGLTDPHACAAVVAVARREGRKNVGCIVLGRGADEAGIIRWLRVAASVPGYIGFAVGRTSFWDALVALRDGKISREAAVGRIADRYVEWVRVFRDGGPRLPA